MDRIINLAQSVIARYPVKKAGIFGSYARSEMTESSDIDIAIEPDPTMDYYLFYDLKEDLEKTLGKKVDLLTYRSLKPSFLEIIKKDERIIYESA